MSLVTTLSSAVLTGVLALSPVAQEIVSSSSSSTALGASSTDNNTPTPSPTNTPSDQPTDSSDEKVEDNDAITEFNTVKAVVAKTSTVKLDKEEVNIIGVEWEGEGNPKPEIRYKKDNGAWSSWEAITADDGGADPGSPDAENENLESMSEIVPITDSSEAQVRFADKDADNVENTEINTVSTEVTSADKQIAKNAPADTDVKNMAAITGQAPATNTLFTPGEASTDTQAYNSAGLDTQVQTAGWNSKMGANIVTRKEWGANEKLKRCNSDVASGAKGVVVHHTAGSNSYTKAQAPGIIRGYLNYHTQSRGWCDLGYNFLVDKYGTIYEGRAGSIDKPMIGAHASGFNTNTVGISVMGTYTKSAPSTAARNSVSRVIAYNANKYGFNPTGKMTLKGGGGSSKYKSGSTVTFNAVSGHRDTGYTECPGLAFQNKLGSVASKAKTIQNDLNKPSAPKVTVKGEIKKYYDKNGGSAKFGKALSNQKTLKNPAGLVQAFAKGHIYYSKSTGAHFINKSTNIFKKWKTMKYEKGALGFPTGKQLKLRKAGGGTYGYVQSFQKGSIVYSPKGTYSIQGSLATKWRSMGWGRSYLGVPTSEQKTGLKDGGMKQEFAGGTLYYSKKSGAWATKKNTAVQKRHDKYKGEQGGLGYPTGSEIRLRKAGSGYYGQYQNFQGGTIVASPKGGSRVVKGDIGKKWKSMGWARSYMGVPTSEQKGGLKNKGTYQRFVGGTMYDSSKTKPFAVKKGTAIDKKWRASGATSGSLGFPTSGELKLRKAGGGTYGVVQSFTGGSIVSSPKGTYIVKGDIGKKWKSMKWGRSELGVPTSDQKGGLKNKGTYQRFAGGTMYDSSNTDPHSVKKGTAIDKKWRSMGATNSILGYPTSNEYKSGSTLKQDFKMGTITYNTKTKKTTYKYALTSGPLVIPKAPVYNFK